MPKQLIYILVFLLSSLLMKAQQGGWKKQYFLQNTLAEKSYNVIECPNGNFIVIGITYDNQYCSYLTLLGTDAQGNELWRKDYGNCQLQYFQPSDKEITEANAFYISVLIRDTNHLNIDGSVLIKFNYQGDTLWQRKYFSGQSKVHLYVQNLSKSIDGVFLLAGYYVDLNSPGGEYSLVMKTDTNGNELWRKIIHKQSPDIMRSFYVIQDSTSKNIILTGYQFTGNSTVSSLLILDSLGNKLTQKSYANGGAFRNTVQLKDKHFVVSGQKIANVDKIFYSPLVVKFDASGNLIWSRQLTAGYLNGIEMVCELQNGDLVALGYMDTVYYGAKKTQFIVLNSNGELKWSRYIGSLRSSPDTHINSEAATSVNRTSDKGFILSTWFYYPDINNPYSIIKLDSTGCDTLPQDCREIMVGVEELGIRNDELIIYPNPANDKLNVYFESGTNAQETKIMLCDIYGREVKNAEIKEETTSIDVDDLPAGIYFITLMQNGKVLARQKVVIMD